MILVTDAGNKRGFADSLTDAVRPWNIFLRIAQFIAFGLITATPYLIYNLDKVGLVVKMSGKSGFSVFISYVGALFSAMWKGFFIGLSTLFSTIINLGAVIDQRMIGTMIFSAVVLVFAVMTAYQPIRLFFNIIDMSKGRDHSRLLILSISFAVVVVLSPLAFAITGGETITSNIMTEEDCFDEVKEYCSENFDSNDDVEVCEKERFPIVCGLKDCLNYYGVEFDDDLSDDELVAVRENITNDIIDYCFVPFTSNNTIVNSLNMLEGG